MEPTNNVPEQAIREHVVIRKIIGTFRSESGSQNYQHIVSLLSTWRLQNKSMFVEMDKILRKDLCGFG
jgi:transposase